VRYDLAGMQERNGRGLPLYKRRAGALFWGAKRDLKFYKREGLTQIDLDKLSATRPDSQAVIPATKCSACGILASKALP